MCPLWLDRNDPVLTALERLQFTELIVSVVSHSVGRPVGRLRYHSMIGVMSRAEACCSSRANLKLLRPLKMNLLLFIAGDVT